ncbi:MAG: hypothetical protein ACOYT4_02505 [Nanoarchaeota archaeon]
MKKIKLGLAVLFSGITLSLAGDIVNIQNPYTVVNHGDKTFIVELDRTYLYENKELTLVDYKPFISGKQIDALIAANIIRSEGKPKSNNSSIRRLELFDKEQGWLYAYELTSNMIEISSFYRNDKGRWNYFCTFKDKNLDGINLQYGGIYFSKKIGETKYKQMLDYLIKSKMS